MIQMPTITNTLPSISFPLLLVSFIGFFIAKPSSVIPVDVVACDIAFNYVQPEV
jgi:hypothetical protein